MLIPLANDLFDAFRAYSAIGYLPNGCPLIECGDDNGIVVTIISGIHGDERSGPLSILRLLESEGFEDYLLSMKVNLRIAPLVNDHGWDNDTREWMGIDLNRSFSCPNQLLHELKNWILAKPSMAFVDLHEDSDVEYPYIFQLNEDTSSLTRYVASELHATLEPWDYSDEWSGSSEVFARKNGIHHCITTEAPPIWSLEDRIQWNTRAIKSVLDFVVNTPQ